MGPTPSHCRLRQSTPQSPPHPLASGGAPAACPHLWLTGPHRHTQVPPACSQTLPLSPRKPQVGSHPHQHAGWPGGGWAAHERRKTVSWFLMKVMRQFHPRRPSGRGRVGGPSPLLSIAQGSAPSRVPAGAPSGHQRAPIPPPPLPVWPDRQGVGATGAQPAGAAPLEGTPGPDGTPSAAVPAGGALAFLALTGGGESREGPGSARTTGRADHNTNGSGRGREGSWLELDTSNSLGWGGKLTAPWGAALPALWTLQQKPGEVHRTQSAHPMSPT